MKLDPEKQADALLISVNLYKRIVQIIRHSIDGLSTVRGIVS